MLSPVILAGGYGERLWPLSTPDMPKPFSLRDARGHSLFQATILRVANRAKFAPPLVVCNSAHQLLVREQLRAIGCEDATMMLEPEARNTAPAIALAAFHIMNESPHSVMLVMPADHHIDAPEHLLAALDQASAAAEAGHVVTFAITPTAPETGYGYIQRGAAIAVAPSVFAIAKFIEKPEREVAERLLKAGDYGWNSGMFVMRASQALVEFEQHAPEILAACRAAYGLSVFDGSCVMPDAECFARARAVAFDRAIMERTTRGAVMPLAMGWRDLGNWAALYELATKDARGNAVTGEATLHDVENSHIYSDGTPINAVGLHDMLVVAANGQLLVAPKQRGAEACSAAVEHYKKRGDASVTQRPWGEFHIIEAGAQYQVKQLTLRPRGKISLQRHAKRSEHWVVVSGMATVTRGQEQFMLYENQSTFIAAGVMHRLENNCDEPLVIIEVQTGSYLGEDDIERFEDMYARVSD